MSEVVKKKRKKNEGCVTFHRWFFGNKVPITLTAGKIDNAAREVFMNGQCHSLALAIHKLKGWDIYGITDSDGDFIHILVSSPKGYLDINGLDAHSKFIKQWGASVNSIDNLKALKPVDILNIHGYFKANPKKAESFAKAIIKKYFPEEG